MQCRMTKEYCHRVRTNSVGLQSLHAHGMQGVQQCPQTAVATLHQHNQVSAVPTKIPASRSPQTPSECSAMTSTESTMSGCSFRCAE